MEFYGIPQYRSDTSNLEEYKEPEFDNYLKVLEFGAKKYGKNNWLEKGTNASHLHRYKSAMGHIARGVFGDNPYDEESGLLHLDHAIACLQMIKTMKMRGISW